MATLDAYVTGTTCGWACWYARESTCRCSCGGAAHGVMLTSDGALPRRNCRIQGVRYVLGTVGGYGETERIARDFRKTLENDERFFVTYGSTYHFVLHNERRAVTWRKSASDAQVAKWPELAEHKPAERWHSNPSLLWIREDAAELFDAWLAEQEAKTA